MSRDLCRLGVLPLHEGAGVRAPCGQLTGGPDGINDGGIKVDDGPGGLPGNGRRPATVAQGHRARLKGGCRIDPVIKDGRGHAVRVGGGQRDGDIFASGGDGRGVKQPREDRPGLGRGHGAGIAGARSAERCRNRQLPGSRQFLVIRAGIELVGAAEPAGAKADFMHAARQGRIVDKGGFGMVVIGFGRSRSRQPQHAVGGIRRVLDDPAASMIAQ